jgi:hypothetical protein
MDTHSDRFPLGRLYLFTVLSLVDLILTWALLNFAEGKVYELNPIALAWLVKYGWPGFVVFKFLGVSLIGFIAVFVARHQPRTAARILTFACVAVGLVLIYTCYIGICVLPRLH